MAASSTPVFVRLATADAQLLNDAVASSGRTKRQLVGDAVREHLGGDPGQLVVGRVAPKEPPPEVLTVSEAAALLRVEESTLEQEALSRAIPGRRIGEQWRFSHDALLAWLGACEPAATETRG